MKEGVGERGGWDGHLFLHLNVELLYSLQCELLLFDEDSDWVSHESLGHLQHIGGHCSGQ